MLGGVGWVVNDWALYDWGARTTEKCSWQLLCMSAQAEFFLHMLHCAGGSGLARSTVGAVEPQPGQALLQTGVGCCSCSHQQASSSKLPTNFFS